MRRRTAAALAVGLATTLLSACGGAGQPANPVSPTASYDPALSGPDTPAATLRLRWTLLLEEHQLLTYRETGAQATGHPDQAAAYQDQLTRNGSDLADLIAATDPAPARERFTPLWSAHLRALTGLAAALAAHNPQTAQQLLADQSGSTTPQLADLLAQVTGAPRATLAGALAQQLADSSAIATAQAAGNESAAQETLRGATGRLATLAAVITRATHAHHPAVSRGDPDSRAATLAVDLAALFQRHAYQTDAAGTALGGPEMTAAGSRALTATTADLARIIDSVFGSDARRRFTAAWTARDHSLLAYAAAAARTDAAGEQRALQDLTRLDTPRLADVLEALLTSPGEELTPPLLEQATAAAAVFDAEAAGRAVDAARADRQAAAVSAVFALRLAVAITSQAPSRFA